MSLHRTTIDSPIGPLTLTGDRDGLVSLYMEDQRHRPPEVTSGPASTARELAPAVAQLERYFAGELVSFDVPLRPAGTAFQLAVWDALRTIPYGETRSYGELATAIGCPGAARAVGLANGKNPISIIVPCHRVIGANGTLTGYGGGLERKRWLLEHETLRLL